MYHLVPEAFYHAGEIVNLDFVTPRYYLICEDYCEVKYDF